MQKANNTITSNKKGFTLIEVLVVVAMIVALTALGGSGFAALSHARANKVVKSIDTLLSQSKVNALSGKENTLEIFYNENEDRDNGYKSKTYYGVLKDRNGNIYETEELGNSLVTINCSNGGDVGKNACIKAKFNTKTGKIEYCCVKNPNASVSAEEISNTPNKITIYASFGSTYAVEIFKLTGEHHVVGQ